MADGIKYTFECGLVYLFIKKHFCIQCKSLLIRMKLAKVINSFSEEAKYYDFSLDDTWLIGDIKFITYYFECPKCGKIYSIREMKQLKI